MSTITEQTTAPNLTVANLTVLGTYSGDGSGLTDLTNLDADQLTTGIVPDARMPNLTGDVTTVEGTVATTVVALNNVSNPTFTDSVAVSGSGSVYLSATSTGSESSLRLVATGTGGRDYRLRTGDTASGLNGGFILYDETATATRITVNSSGYVGIGLDPTSPLHVNGGIQSQSGDTYAQLYATGTDAIVASLGAYPLSLRTDSVERLLIKSTGEVGIGMTPVKTLDVTGTFGTTGDATIGGVIGGSAGSASAPAYTFSTDTNTGIYRSAADTLAFSTGGTLRMSINSSGYIGIGLDATAPLHVNGGIQSQSGDTYAQLYATGTDAIVASLGAYPLSLRTNSTERIQIKSTGEVGIGMTPSRTLDVTGTFGTTGAATIGGVLTFKSATTGLSRLSGGDPSSASVTAGNTFAPVVSGGNGNGLTVVVNTNTGASAIVYFYYSNGVTIVAQSGAEFVTADPGAGTSKTWIQNTSSSGTLTLTNRFAAAQQYAVISMSNS